MITKPGHENERVLALVQTACPSISVFPLQAPMISIKVNAINHPLQDQKPACWDADKRCWKKTEHHGKKEANDRGHAADQTDA